MHTFNVEQDIMQCKLTRNSGDEGLYASQDDLLRAMFSFYQKTHRFGINPSSLESFYDGNTMLATWDDEAVSCLPTDANAKRFNHWI